MLRQLLSTISKYGVPVLLDVLSVILAYYLALALRFAGRAPLNWLLQFRQYILGLAGAHVLFNALFGVYSRLWPFASLDDSVSIIESVVTGVLLIAAADLLWFDGRPLPLSVVLAGGLFTLGAFVVTRYRSQLLRAFLRRWRSRAELGASSNGTRVLLVGAGEAGQALAQRLQNHEQGRPYTVVGFVDDDPAKQGMVMQGLQVVGDRNSIPQLVRQMQVELIVIAIYTISAQDLRAILAICQGTDARVKTLPDVFESLESLTDPALLRDITLDDLIGREHISLDHDLCHGLVAGKVVLVSGAGGTIGSEVCRLVIEFEPRLLVMLDNNETGLFELDWELRARIRDMDAESALPSLCYVVADITHRQRMESVFNEYRPQIVIHAAAYKHVPLMERFPEEAVRVNVGGTALLLELAVRCGAQRFVFVSSDKAVEPVCVMGASKRLGELLVGSVNPEQGMVATAVRFGNVLGSRGSVVPTFERQILEGGPVTVTDPEVTRFFMSIPEAARFILQAASMAQDGEVFIPNMGQPVSIVDLAHKMIRLRGLRVGEDIRIAYTGMRPGEKLQEKLVADSEEPLPSAHPRIHYVRARGRRDRAAFLADVEELLSAAQHSVPSTELRTRLFALAREQDAAQPRAQEDVLALD